MDFKKCSKINKNKVVSASEKGKIFRIENRSLRRISKVEVDGCLITDDKIRCDYLFEIDKPITEVIYLELKGKNINKAYRQLKATIGYLKTRHSKVVKKFAYIVASRVPKPRGNVRELKVKMKRDYNTQLFVRIRKAEVTV
ncbi:MAG: hypothetical protein JRJ49_10100 [Deltaproteobacteria bacterium]|nr:hypothetical protein [Deltaproteobacteria bacterium]